MRRIVAFMNARKRYFRSPKTVLSLFSGGGISDIGYEQAGFQVVAQCDKDDNRAMLCRANFPQSCVEAGTVAERWPNLVDRYKWRNLGRLQLMSITPPCQGMSSSNPGRGKIGDPSTRDERNLLLLDAIPVIHALRPRIFVVENVVQVLQEFVTPGTKHAKEEAQGEFRRIVDTFRDELSCYRLFAGVVEMADYGIPQNRRRAILVGIHRSEPCVQLLEDNNLNPWPKPTHAAIPTDRLQKWVTVREWFELMDYPQLDAASRDTAADPNDPFHYVPSYAGDAYLRVADIPPYSGRNAYENANCRSCGFEEVPPWQCHCTICGAEMRNRPYVVEPDGTFRLIKGFDSSYRRMHPDQPAPTVTTATGHVGSDIKIHPYENRVLSPRECIDLQTIPRFYSWEWAFYINKRALTREVSGEAIPSYFTYRHGKVLNKLLSGTVGTSELAARKL